jgi:hypothetical protein
MLLYYIRFLSIHVLVVLVESPSACHFDTLDAFNTFASSHIKLLITCVIFLNTLTVFLNCQKLYFLTDFITVRNYIKNAINCLWNLDKTIFFQHIPSIFFSFLLFHLLFCYKFFEFSIVFIICNMHTTFGQYCIFGTKLLYSLLQNLLFMWGVIFV